MTKIMIPSSISIYVTLADTSSGYFENWLGRKFVRRDYSAQIREAERIYDIAWKKFEMTYKLAESSGWSPYDHPFFDKMGDAIERARLTMEKAKSERDYWTKRSDYDRKEFYDKLSKDANQRLREILISIASVVIPNQPILAYEWDEHFEKKR